MSKMNTISRSSGLINKGTRSRLGDLTNPVPQGRKNPLHLGLPQRLSTVRSAAGTPAKHLSFAAGLSEGVVRSIEDGNNRPRVDTVERIAAALGVSACWLAFGLEGDREFAKRPREQSTAALPVAVVGGLPFRELYRQGGDRLCRKREALGLSLRELAAAAGVSFATIRKWEIGTAVPNVETCERLAVALGVAPCWLAYGHGEGS